MGEQLVDVRWVEPGVAVIEIQRESHMNALNCEVLDHLEEALDTVEGRGEARVAVVTGQGTRAFVAGADIGAIHRIEDGAHAQAFAVRGQLLFQRFQQSRIIFIGAINGYALGGGMELAMALDMRIAAETAKLGQPEINLGIIPGFGGTQRLSRLVGPGMALWLVASGKPVDASEARALGLVDWVVPPAALLDECLARARELAGKAPLALAEVKRLVAHSRDWHVMDGLAEEARAFSQLAVSQDGREGTKAFLEKRAPKFHGR
jgi:enoyl-CoA hydratase